MKRTLIAGAAFASLFAVTSASAADLSAYSKAPAVAAVYDWTGYYLGTNVGYSMGRGSTNGSYTAYSERTVYTTASGAVVSDVITPLPGGLLSGNANMNGPAAGTARSTFAMWQDVPRDRPNLSLNTH